jgi:hypothetical protein
MSLQPPRILAPRPAPGAVDVLEYEIMQEKAAALGRLTRTFEAALAALADFDAVEARGPEAPEPAHRETLLDAAGRALFDFVVQREACGLRNTEAVLKHYNVPAAVRLRMGIARRP